MQFKRLINKVKGGAAFGQKVQNENLIRMLPAEPRRPRPLGSILN